MSLSDLAMDMYVGAGRCNDVIGARSHGRDLLKGLLRRPDLAHSLAVHGALVGLPRD
jgi:hypothetical protein